MKKEILEEINMFDKIPIHPNGFTLALSPKGLLVNFRMSMPQITDDGEKMIIAIHKVVILEPEMIKALSEGLKDQVKSYETKFSKIKSPKFETNEKGNVTTKEDNYFG